MNLKYDDGPSIPVEIALRALERIVKQKMSIAPLAGNWMAKGTEFFMVCPTHSELLRVLGGTYEPKA